MSRWILICTALLLAHVQTGSGQSRPSSAATTRAQSLPAPSPTDLLEFEDPQRLSLSPDGQRVLLATRRASVSDDESKTSQWVVSIDTPATRRRLDLPPGARSVQWGTDADQIVFLAPGQEHLQVWARSVRADSSEQLTRVDEGVDGFRLSPGAEHIAFSVRKQRTATGGTSDSLSGVEVDMKTFSDRGLRGELAAPTTWSVTELWIKDLETGTSRTVSGSLSVEDYVWSPSGDRLAVVGVPAARKKKQVDGVPLYRTDLYVYEPSAGRLRTIHEGHQDRARLWEGTITYSNPFWSPNGTRLGFVRTDESERFGSAGDVGIVNVEADTTRYLTTADEKEFDGPTFHWLSPDTLLVEYTHHARQGLFRLSLEDGRTTPVWRWRGDAGGFSFDRDGRRAVWVQESIGHPPELYTDRRPLDEATRITSLNEDVRAHWLPRAQSIHWQSTDGTTVQGWLIGARDHSESIPPPLLVYVHGGPGAELNNRFSLNRGWGRPIQLFAARGYAVFVPNYRQSDSFGPSFQDVEALDREPVQDVVTGIEHLISGGEADPDRIGIMGNSWGAWLGPQVAAEKPVFQAASFAEGVNANALSAYGRSPGWVARGLREYQVGTTPYENPKRYLELSAAYRNRFTKTTPTLLEYGQDSPTVAGGLELGRALWRHGTPHEVVIYPDAGHGLETPSLILESMRRNLQWFERWIPSRSESFSAGE